MTFNFKGTTIFYEASGNGSAVILLHGFLENSTIWNSLEEELLTNYRIVTIDLLGHGKTGCLGYIHTMEMMAETVKVVLDKLMIRHVSLIGHSMGGYVALAFAEMYPDSIKALVLVNSTASPDSEVKKENRNRAIEMVKHNHKSFVQMGIANLFLPKNRKIFAEEIKTLKREALKTSIQGILAALEGIKIRNNREILLHFTSFPKMMIIGRKDPVLNYEALIEQVKETEVEVVVLPDGHMSFIENKLEFIDTIKKFLKKIDTQ